MDLRTNEMSCIFISSIMRILSFNFMLSCILSVCCLYAICMMSIYAITCNAVIPEYIFTGFSRIFKYNFHQMRKRQTFIIYLFFCILFTVNAQQTDWENQYVLQINREPARAAFIAYGSQSGDRNMSLNGVWKFHWAPTPDGRIADFYTENFNDKAWVGFPVPANWEVNGYGTPIYVSSGYPFRIDPPRVTSVPKENYTAFKERNPVGQYRRSFMLPAGWKASGQTFLRFDGVQSAFYVWVNGVRVGYSQGSMEPSEFNVTKYLKAGENKLAVEVYKYCDGSYLGRSGYVAHGRNSARYNPVSYSRCENHGCGGSYCVG